YDHVLANSMSGNVVLAGIAVTTGQWHQIWWHLLPIMAFLAGVWAAEKLRLPRVRAVVRHPTAACLGLEAAFLTIAAGSAHIPAALMTSGISFVAAAQTTTFRQLRGTPYHSVVMTGNLRSFGTASFVGLFAGNAGQRRDAARFGAVCLAFATGAAIGGWSTPTLGNPALLIVAGLLTLVLVMLCGRIPLWGKVHAATGSRRGRWVASPSEDEHGRTDTSMCVEPCLRPGLSGAPHR
ncbi:MAG TPA: YoaK family protein, partial [Streptosporangiaceae bacterium]|nr:YoaK family protein [Streptosporangiaceae bacterium]